MRLLLTENCNANCSFCFNANIRTGKNMDTEKAKILIDYLANYVPKIKFMGGEPTTHPDFVELCEHTQSKAVKLSLFTNAVNDEILKVKPRPCDVIIYNYEFIGKKFNYDKLLPAYNFGRVFETRVGSKVDIDTLFNERIMRTIETCQRLNIEDRILFSVTLDCMENIFEHRDILNEKWADLVKRIIAIDEKYLGFDHKIPPCFWTGDTLDLINSSEKLNRYAKMTCKPEFTGLINANFDLVHCNQLSGKLGSIFKEGSEGLQIMEAATMINLLVKANLNKRMGNLDNPVCVNCVYARKDCTGGCFMHKYSAEDLQHFKGLPAADIFADLASHPQP